MTENNNQKPDVATVCVNALVRLCASCKYWQGDKSKVQADYSANPLSMDLLKGWPEYGCCVISDEWAEIFVSENATADLTVPANFGCPYWAA